MQFNYISKVECDLSSFLASEETKSAFTGEDDEMFSELMMCKAFMRGDKCKAMLQAEEQSEKLKKPVKFSCYFSHDREAHAKQQMRNGICRAHFRDQSCKHGGACKFSHDFQWLNDLREKNGECVHYTKTGRCKFGNACVYKHDNRKRLVHTAIPEC